MFFRSLGYELDEPTVLEKALVGARPDNAFWPEV